MRIDAVLVSRQVRAVGLTDDRDCQHRKHREVQGKCDEAGTARPRARAATSTISAAVAAHFRRRHNRSIRRPTQQLVLHPRRIELRPSRRVAVALRAPRSSQQDRSHDRFLNGRLPRWVITSASAVSKQMARVPTHRERGCCADFALPRVVGPLARADITGAGCPSSGRGTAPSRSRAASRRGSRAAFASGPRGSRRGQTRAPGSSRGSRGSASAPEALDRTR